MKCVWCNKTFKSLVNIVCPDCITGKEENVFHSSIHVLLGVLRQSIWDAYTAQCDHYMASEYDMYYAVGDAYAQALAAYDEAQELYLIGTEY